jgi:predicted methyltransferase
MQRDKKSVVLRAAVCVLVLAGLVGLGGCSSLYSSPPDAVLSQAQIDRIIASADRSATDRTNDQRRNPAAMLAFIGVRPGMVVLDLSAAGGYTTELLARATGPSGTVFGQSLPRDPSRPVAAPAAPEGNSHPNMAPAVAAAVASPAAAPAPVRRTSAEALAERDKALKAEGVPAAPIVTVAAKFEDPAPAAYKTAALDLVTLMFNYHDLGFQPIDRDRMNRAVFAALKPGGIYVIADHAGRDGTGISEAGTLHRMEEAFLIREVESAGFKLAARGDFLRNPNDPRDKNTPNPPQPKDEFVVKFVRP